MVNEHGLEPTLTAKREAFCHEYIRDLNGTQAAIRAGYAPESAYSEANRLLRIVEIRNRISELKKERAEAQGVGEEDLLGYFRDVLAADVSEFYKEDGKTLKAAKDLRPEARRALAGYKPTAFGMQALLVDKKWAAQMLAAHLGMNAPVKIEHTGLSADPDAIAKAIAEAMINDDKGDA